MDSAVPRSVTTPPEEGYSCWKTTTGTGEMFYYNTGDTSGPLRHYPQMTDSYSYNVSIPICFWGLTTSPSGEFTLDELL